MLYLAIEGTLTYFPGFLTREIIAKGLDRNTFSDFCTPLFGPPTATKFAPFPLHTLELRFGIRSFLAFSPMDYLYPDRPDIPRADLPTNWKVLLARFSHLKVLKLSLQGAGVFLETAKRKLSRNIRELRRHDAEPILRGNAEYFGRLVRMIVEAVPDGVEVDFGGEDEKMEWKKMIPEQIVDQELFDDREFVSTNWEDFCDDMEF